MIYRHAEKRKSRVSSCILADRIAACVIAKYREVCPSELQGRYQQTVLAGIVMLAKNIDDDRDGKICVISIGVGTKLLSSALIVEDCKYMDGNRRVHDCHAEVLAKRGFQAFLYEEALHFASDVSYLHHNPYFQYVDDTSYPRYRLKDHVSIYLYSSSQPCGNATIKKWAKCSKPHLYPDLPNDTYPVELHHHARLAVTAREQGQVAVLVKRDAALTLGDVVDNGDESSAMVVPAGMAMAGAGQGKVMSCSDKICIWNAMGIQGGLLSAVYDPIYVDAIIIGRKFSQIHCQRALCCRLQDFIAPASSTSSSTYSIHHPAMLNTAVVFDESIMMMTSDASSDTSFRAQFQETRCYSWWSCPPRHSYAQVDSGSSSIIDSCSGYEAHDDMSSSVAGVDVAQDVHLSPLCSYRLAMQYSKLCAAMNQSSAINSLSYADLKHKQSAYNQAKDYLLSAPQLFGEWHIHRKRRYKTGI